MAWMLQIGVPMFSMVINKMSLNRGAFLIITTLLFFSPFVFNENITEIIDEDNARNVIFKLDEKYDTLSKELLEAMWNYDNDLTDENLQILMKLKLNLVQERKRDREMVLKYRLTEFKNDDLRFKFNTYTKISSSELLGDRYEILERTKLIMLRNYSTAKICDFFNASKCDLDIDKKIKTIFATSTDTEELKHTWVEWHKVAGSTAKKSFVEYVNLVNEEAQLNNFTNKADYWLSQYGDENVFEELMLNLWNYVNGLYRELHAYVRKQLFNKYGPDVINRKGPIPAHLLGNMWAQKWDNLQSFTRPYPDLTAFDVTNIMIQQNYTAMKMFKMAEQFYVSLNINEMTDKFWKNSIFEKPPDSKNMNCHGSSWDFRDGEDYRIKMCTLVDQEHFEEVYHEVGHIVYSQEYKNQPNKQNKNLNPALREAIGDLTSLSAFSPRHLKKIGLINEELDEKAQINYLYSKALKKIVFLPFAFMLDLYRYSIFRGETTPENYNCHYWKLRENLQGLEPPLNRTEDDFDAVAKLHLFSNNDYMRYYLATFIEFRFHQVICESKRQQISSHSTKLTDCDIYGYHKAGDSLKALISSPKLDTIENIKMRYLNYRAILEYFEPLYSWLKEENLKTGEIVGWTNSAVEYCTKIQEENFANTSISEFVSNIKNNLFDST